MEFVQYNRLKYDCILISALMGPVTMFLLCALLQRGDWKTAALLAIMELAAIACLWCGWRVMKQSIIHIDQTGISLTRKGKQEWAFAWEEIHRVSYGSAMSHRGVFFVPKEKPMNMDAWTVLPSRDYRFHLNKTAKEALARYCPLPIEK